MAIEMHDGARSRRTRADGVRRCAATGRPLDKSRLVRFVSAPDGSVVADIAGTLPGRGIWVGADRLLVERACGKGGPLARAGRVSQELADQIERQLSARCQSIVGLARRAGELALGQEAVRAMLRAGDAGVLVVARDAASDGREKIAKLQAAAAPDVAMVGTLDRAELGQAVGRAEAVFLAVRNGRLAERLSDEGTRLAGFRSMPNVGETAPTTAEHELTKEAERR